MKYLYHKRERERKKALKRRRKITRPDCTPTSTSSAIGSICQEGRNLCCLNLEDRQKEMRSGTVAKSNCWSSTIGEMVLHPEFGIIWEEKHKGVAECQHPGEFDDPMEEELHLSSNECSTEVRVYIDSMLHTIVELKNVTRLGLF
jgi:hypothetical protein